MLRIKLTAQHSRKALLHSYLYSPDGTLAAKLQPPNSSAVSFPLRSVEARNAWLGTLLFRVEDSEVTVCRQPLKRPFPAAFPFLCGPDDTASFACLPGVSTGPEELPGQRTWAGDWV
jgi:hypothetical protein